ncbi:tautomerase family protein [Elizabethkingia ursingii]|uniref:4-oxalocrotonate tautomerase n=1 Tax=Elizabethkingia ursingii TaxID=1756150 RepID=A0AAJ3NFD2_9FLAO|nr:tautomerase family protein [Elizabethkingia ursingii]AQX07312.1 4-oxalocrotonate tautomerase [Elizabethkingia ursingii]OPB80282.1 4-oxalocrotonate tautomerase [Elizabethkingia ursingii]
MPLVRISLSDSYQQETIDFVSSSIHQALLEVFCIPDDDYFHIIESLCEEHLKYPNEYLKIKHSSKIVYIQIFASKGRTIRQKEHLYKTITDNIKSNADIPPNEIIILLTEIEGKENWSFGNGAIQTIKHI